MAINFGDTIMEGGIEPSVRVQSPVQDNSGAILAEGLGGVAKTVGAIVGSIFQQGQVDNKTKILTAYEQELLDLADGVDQGAMSSKEAMTRARALRGQYLSNAPTLQTEFDKIWSNFAGATGLGHVVVEGTIEQQAFEARTIEAIKLGYTPQEYEVFQARANQATALNSQLDIIKANGGIVTETMRNQSLQSVVGLADAAFPAAQTQINNAMKAIEANPNNKAAIVAELNNTMGQNIAQLQALSGNADAAFLVTPIQGLLDTFNKWGSGEIENSVLEASIKNTQLQYSAMYANDPVLGPIIAQSKLLNDLGLAQTQLGMEIWSPEAIKKLRDVTQGSVNLVDGTEGSNRFAGNIVEIAGTITPASDPALVTETMNAVNAAVEGVWKHERSAEDGALGFKDTVEMLGSPQVGQLIQQAGGISAAHSDQFVGILQENYEAELVPAIQSYWMSSPLPVAVGSESVVSNDTPMSELLQPVWNGSVVEFIPNDAYKSDPRVISLATDVNSGSNSIGIPLNNLINAYANVTGVDPKTIWEQDFASRLFNLGQGGAPIDAGPTPVVDRVNQMLDGGNAEEAGGETFTIGDFNPDTLEPVAEYTSQASGLSGVLPPIPPSNLNDDGIDFASYLPSIRAAESGGDDNARNPTSTATGRYQFLTSTWNGLVQKYPNAGLTADGRTNPQQQEIAIRLFTAENARYLKNNNIPINNATLYGAHFLGAGDAVKVLAAPATDLVSAHVPSSVINANSFLRGKTVAWFNDWINRKGNA